MLKHLVTAKQILYIGKLSSHYYIFITKCLSIPVDGYAILPQIPLTDLVTVDLG
ncbi:hypothetical protein TSMEX_009035 [Taenia solium]